MEITPVGSENKFIDDLRYSNKKEVKEAVKTEKKEVTPSKFEGKSEEERLKIYQYIYRKIHKKSKRQTL